MAAADRPGKIIAPLVLKDRGTGGIIAGCGQVLRAGQDQVLDIVG